MVEPLPNCTSPAPTSPVVTKENDEDDSNNSSSSSNNMNSNKTDKVKTVATAQQDKNDKPAITRAPSPLVSTPARDPASLVTKRMQNLKLHANSTLSPTPFAAGSPMRTFHNNSNINNLNMTPNKQFDLTPVMKNTSTTACPMGPDAVGDLDLDLELDFDLDMLDARETHNNDMTSCGGNVFSARRLKPGSSSMLPPLSNRGLLPGPRPPVIPASNNKPQPSSHSSPSPLPPPPPIAIDVPIDPNPPLRAPELAFLPPNAEEVVPFPPSGGKGYSFTSRKQYEQELRRQQQPEPFCLFTAANMNDLAPYQPSRQDPGLEQPEELGSIFITRRTSSHGDGEVDVDTELSPQNSAEATKTATATILLMSNNPPDGNHGSSWYSEDICCDDEDLSLEDNPLLQQAIPLGDRQWSIPSIRLANQLNGSVNSCTTYYTDEEEDDDESSLLLDAYYRDDASLSSYGSYSHLTGTIVVLAQQQQQGEVAMWDTTPQPAPQLQNQQYKEEEEQMDTGSNAMDTQHAPALSHHQQPTNTFNGHNNDYHDRRRRQKRKQQRDRKALEWLRGVKATTSENEVAEAASSKFLRSPISNSSTMMGTMMRNTNNNAQILYDKPQQKKRLSSAAVETSTFGLTISAAATADDQVEVNQRQPQQQQQQQQQCHVHASILPTTATTTTINNLNGNKEAVFNLGKGHQRQSVSAFD